MKTLPILSGWLLAIAGLTWVAWETGTMTLLAQAMPAAQTESRESDTKQNAADVAPPPESPEALAVMQEARRTLFDRGSVQAKLRETVRMGGRSFQADGEYFAGRFPKLRLSFKINSGDASAELLEVCDGQILWTVQRLATADDQKPEEQVARTVIGDLQEAFEETENIAETSLIAHMGVGGLPSLLAALERSMTLEAMRELEADGSRYTVIQGRWKDRVLNRFKLGDEKVQLPEYVPDHVRIYFDAETSFPTRILYLKETEPGSRKFTALLSLEFLDVVLDAPVSDDLFQYTPAESTQVRDRTRDFLEMIKSAEESIDEQTQAADTKSPVDEK